MPICYDEAVPFYDATRGYRAGVAEGYRDACLAVAGPEPEPRILELGIGTGLIAEPFIAAGHSYCGVDLSRGMMRELAGKLPGARRPLLAQADILRMPFAPACFDIIHAVRVFHHVEAWRAGIDEARRLLAADGALLIVENVPPAGADPPPWALAQERWDESLRRLGVGAAEQRRDIRMADDIMLEYMRACGAEAAIIHLLEYLEKAISPRMMVERRAKRMFSSDWALPEAIHREATRALYDWLERECDAPDDMVERTMIFRAVVARW